ncbi:MAG: hypothetical protein FJX29_10520, partial [Alphaproteobacteria bacterium]|nr:hypothetical protein [Alphaproteobacteria bacterium]
MALKVQSMFRTTMLAAAAALALIVSAPAQAQSPSQAEITFWTSIQNSKNAAEYEAYLQVFPNGTFAPLARLRIQQLGGGGSPGGNRAGGGEPPPPPFENNPPPRQASN